MMILLVNKAHLFDENYLDMIELVEYENFKEDLIYLERETYEHFLALQSHLRIDGIDIDILDGYRSLEAQENIFLKYMKKYGLDAAEAMVEMPGMSDFHTGMAISFTICKDGNWLSEAEIEEEEKVLDKIYRDMKYFGFILRYPKNKRDITGFAVCNHLRYIGREAEKVGDLCLEEYLANKKEV